jgi:RpiR family transcriptional regulator, carbohydrate utilization regulator
LQSLLALIRTKYNTLSPVQKKIADFVLNHPEQVMFLSISDLAGKCGTSETTVVRFLHKLGFDSYQVFRVLMAQENSAQSVQGIYEDIHATDSQAQIRQKVVQSTVNSIKDLNQLLTDATMTQAVNAIVQARQILFCGVGASGIVAADACHKFLRLGLDVHIFTDSHLMSIACTHAGPDTVIVAVTHSGESRDVLEALELAKGRKAKLIGLTSYAHSSVTKIVDMVLLSSANETKYRSDAMVSRVLQLVIVDILYVTAVLQLGSTAINKVNASRLAVAKKKT